MIPEATVLKDLDQVGLEAPVTISIGDLCKLSHRLKYWAWDNIRKVPKAMLMSVPGGLVCQCGWHNLSFR